MQVEMVLAQDSGMCTLDDCGGCTCNVGYTVSNYAFSTVQRPILFCAPTN